MMRQKSALAISTASRERQHVDGGTFGPVRLEVFNVVLQQGGHDCPALAFGTDKHRRGETRAVERGRVSRSSELLPPKEKKKKREKMSRGFG